MRNIFMLQMPPGNIEAQVHYEDTIKRRVPLERIGRYLPDHLKATLREVFGNKPIPIWGSRHTERNRKKFDQMALRDEILIVEGSSIKLLGIVAGKLVSPDLSRELWKNLKGDTSAGWDLVYFIANPREIDLDFNAFCKVMGYAENFYLRGFSMVSQEKLDGFYDQYDDLYDILIRLKQNQTLQKKSPAGATLLPNAQAEDIATEVTEEDVERIVESDLVSDHVKMQWKLVGLGLKAGDKVWVPPPDQNKIRRLYDYNDFEPKFVTGIDLPTGYFDNIDVIWKEQFRIDAAFEIENSTAIYSGLLRFADLTIVAPNTVYPLFIVAPGERRGQVRAQLQRPSFQQLKLNSKVWFLPYERVEEIERFFETSAGLSVEIIQGKAERLT
jgi:hypothetical protein